MVAELEALQSADEAAGWALRSLPAKNTLTAADADLVEAGFFRTKLAAFGDGRAGDGLPAVFSSGAYDSNFGSNRLAIRTPTVRHP